MRVLITGATGFAGRWLVRACRQAGDDVTEVFRQDNGCQAHIGHVARVDLRDARAIERVVAERRPEVVYHLAALSHVGRSWQEPAATLDVNIGGAVNLLEAIRRHAPRARTVWVSSCEVYGSPLSLPIRESAPIAPRTPYGVSKAAGELLANVYSDAHDMDIVVVRPFNHAGPGQQSAFIFSSLAKQAAEALITGVERLRLVTGNPRTRRDFTDVRDVVRAYRLLGSDPGTPGPYNISSGRSTSVAEHVAALAALIAPIEVEHAVDPALVRANDVLDSHGTHERLTAASKWQPEIPLSQTMSDTIAWWQTRLVSAA